MSARDLASLAFDLPESVWQGVMRADHMAWMDVQPMTAVQRALEQTGGYGPLAREAFLGLYAQSPGLQAEPPPPLRVLARLFDQAEALPEWQGLRASVDADPIAAAFGAAYFSLDLLYRLPKPVQEAVQHAATTAQAASEAQQALQELGELRQGLPEGAHAPPARALQDALEQLRGRAAQAQAEAGTAEAVALAALESARARLAQSLAGALADVGEELRELKHAARAFGAGWGSGQGRLAPAAVAGLESLAAALRQFPQLCQILKELGWAQRLVGEQVRKNQSGRESFTHYQVDAFDPETLAPEEWTGLLLGDPASPLVWDFWARAFDDDLAHRRFAGPEAVGRGPIIFLRDTSGSMQSPPARHELAAALELALMQWARGEGRRFVSIPFSGPGQFAVYDPGPQPALQPLVEHLRFGYWGGTEPYGPLAAAIHIVQHDPAFQRGDLLILTDGAFAPPPPAFLDLLQAARAKPGLRLVAIVVADRPGAADFTDRVVVVRDLLRERDRLAQAIAGIVQS